MNKTKESAAMVNNSNHTANAVIVSGNLPEVEIQDSTTTKGKVSAKFNLNDQTELEASVDKIDKNKLFSVELADYFCPVRFDSSTLEEALSPLVSSGIMSDEVKTATIEKAKREFLEAHADEIKDSQNLTFAEVLEKLQANETLYKKVLTACNVSELVEGDYIENGKVCIFRANQCKDKDGNDRYTDSTLSRIENGKTFTQALFVEYREITTNNILLAIRYHQSKQEAAKRLLNQISDYKRTLQKVYLVACDACRNGFSIEQVEAEIKKAFLSFQTEKN